MTADGDVAELASCFMEVPLMAADCRWLMGL